MLPTRRERLVLASQAWRNTIRYNEGERKMAGDAGRRRGKHQESVTLRANEKIKRQWRRGDIR